MRIVRPRMRFILLPAALLACATCNSQRPTTRPSKAAPSVAATEPSTDTPPPNEVDRLSGLYPPLKEQWLAYLAKEGDARRGDEFSALAMQLDEACFSGTGVRTRTLPANRAKELEVLSFLGLPRLR
jgi:hypothetical protein